VTWITEGPSVPMMKGGFSMVFVTDRNASDGPIDGLLVNVVALSAQRSQKSVGWPPGTVLAHLRVKNEIGYAGRTTYPLRMRGVTRGAEAR